MLIKKTIPLDMFEVSIDVYIYTNDSIDKIQKIYDDFGINKTVDEYYGVCAFDFDNKKGLITILHREKAGMVGTISHESFHLISDINRYIGATTDNVNDEYQAYICGYIAK